MPEVLPVLQLVAAVADGEDSVLPNGRLDLQLMQGECALIETFSSARAAALADLCSGMAGLREGAVRFMGYDWSELGTERAAALRGRIGRIYQKGAWIDMLGTHANIMLPQLHHTRGSTPAIVRAATELALLLGLPGLPLARPDRLSEGDLMRAACVRAFLGEPRLLLLESSIGPERAELTAPLLELLAQALERGAAAICFTREMAFWRTQRFPIAHRLSLQDEGLTPMAGA